MPSDIDTYIVFIHIIAGAVFVMFVNIMQLVVGPAMSHIPAGEGKEKAVETLRKRAHISVEIAILIQIVTGIYLLATRWDLIGSNLLLHVKVTFGFVALSIASLMHFYWRWKKQRLKEKGEEEQLAALNGLTRKMEKVVLVCANIAFLMGLTFTHL